MLDSLRQPLAKVHSGGGHRSIPPEETLARIRPLGPKLGITRLGNVTGLDRIGIPVAVAVRPRSRSVAVSQGKGLTLAHAMTSAFMEAAELFHGEQLWTRVRWDSERALRAWSRTPSIDSLSRTLRRFDTRARIPWIEGFDLCDGLPCWIPAELVHTDYKSSAPSCGDYFLSSSNGLASGNHILEAISSGICEVVERDALALWERRTTLARARRKVDLATIDNPDCLALLDLYERSGTAVQVWDITTECGIPVFLCDIRPRVHDPSAMSRRSRGAGCHADRAVALAKALTEAAQVRLTHITGMRDDIFSDAYEDDLAARAGAAFLDARAARLQPRSFNVVPSFTSDDIAEDVRWLAHRLSASGFPSLLVVDLTRPEFDIPVVRVIIPGLEGYSAHPGYRPGARALRAEVNELWE